MAKGKVLEVTPGVKWIGILDPDIRTFDIVMETKFGTTYNSYFINATKKTIIETSKELFTWEYIEKLRSVVNPEEIEYIILNHTEPDHSGSLKHLVKIAPNATVVSSGNGVRYLGDISGCDIKYMVVKDGDTLDLGNKTIKFIGAPNLHWPDSMFSYLVEDQVLFTCDVFGCHFCDERMYDDEVANFDEAFKYYFAVILSPFSRFMSKAIEKIEDLEIKTICPGHGPILRKNWKKYVDLSAAFAHDYVSEVCPDGHKIFIPFVSAYGYTKMMAEKIAEGAREGGISDVEAFDIEKLNFFELDHKIALSNGLIIGSPTLNQNILPQIYTLFAAINPIRDRGKAATSFGSYGWSGEGVGIIDGVLNSLKFNVIQPGLKIRFSPEDKAFDQLREFGRTFAEKLIQLKGNKTE
jgi:NADH oxidase (H2O-forming)